METWGKLLTATLLAVSVMVIAGENPVNLGEKRVEVPVGSPLNLKCDLSTDGLNRFRVAWYFNPSGPSFNESHFFHSSVFFNSSGLKDKGILLNVTSSAKEENEGWYFCKLTQEIPTLSVRNSNGTEVVIEREEHTSHPPVDIVMETKDKQEHTSHAPLTIVTEKQAPASPEEKTDLWLWILVGVSAFILIVLLIIFILLRRRCCKSRGEDPIYVNTRVMANKSPSPRPGKPVEKLKTVSSSQNLQKMSPGGGRYKDGRQRYKE